LKLIKTSDNIMPPLPSTQALKALAANAGARRGLGILSSNPRLPSEHLAKGASSKDATPAKTKQDQKPNNNKRELNTTRAVKASRDASTIDYASMPDLAALDDNPPFETFNVPLLHGHYRGQGVRALGEEQTEQEISKVCKAKS
jgi:hypothetical protein